MLLARVRPLRGLRNRSTFSVIPRYYSTPIDPNSNPLPKLKAAQRLLQLAKPEKKLIAVSFCAMTVSSATTLVFPAVFGKIIDSVSLPGGMEELTAFSLVLLGCFTVGAISSFVRILSIEVASERIVRNLRVRLFENVLSQPLSFFDNYHTGELITRLSSDTAVMCETIVEDTSQGFKRIIEGIGGLSLLVYLSPHLTAIMILLVPPVALGAVSFGRVARAISRKKQDALSASSAVAQERLLAVRTVKAYVQEEREVSYYGEAINEVFKLARTKGIYYGIFAGGIYFAVNMAMLGILYTGALQIIGGVMTVGELATFLFYSLYVGVAFTGISSFWSQFNKALGSSQRVFELLEHYSEEGDKDINLIKLENPQGRIEFRNVSFEYPTRSATVLESFNLVIPSGSSVALVGHSGCGKSTSGHLLSKFYKPRTGSILIDDVDISKLDTKWVRSIISVVSQDIILFSGTIADNISYANPGVPFETIVDAAKQANCHQFIEQFPDGYKTQVGEKGAQLSGGQKQRIAIARALLKDPKILLLDEATSSLDAESEFLVQQALERAMKGRTVILIAHRLSTIITPI